MFVSKSLKHVLFAWILMAAFFSLSPLLNAHVLTETSAQVILRDGQIEIKVLTDIEHLISALQSNQAWLMGDIDSVMPSNLTLGQQRVFIKNALQQKMHITVNDKVIGIERVIFEEQSDNLDKNKSHNKEIVFQARHSFAQVNDLSISFHKSLGVVHTSIVKPQYRLLGAGDLAQIEF